MNPRKILLFFLSVGLLLSIVVYFLPTSGIRIGSFSINMPSFSELLGKDTIQYADISKIVESSKNIDSLPDILNDVKKIKKADFSEVDLSKIELSDNIHPIEFSDNNKDNLINFFEILGQSKKSGKRIRILHYGDSQIEGDRITAFIRNKLQRIFGGSGPGLVPALQPYDSYITVRQISSENWVRYSVFGADTKRVKNKKYGALATFSRFAPILNDSLSKSGTLYHGEVSFQASNLAYSTAKKYQELKIYYANSFHKIGVKIYNGATLIHQDSLQSNVDFASFSYTFESTPEKLILRFSGYDSPNIYGISLDDASGIAVDNISLRGCSGTIFTSIENSHLRKMYEDLNVGLFLLQYGGNVLPYTHSSKAATTYGDWFYAQIMRIKKTCPNAAIVVIGPSDMSIKEKDDYVTYPYLEQVRDALKNAAFKAGAGYWDLYSAMGGRNSMPSWVAANPPLAGTDYTHFTPKGASVVANMFYNALMLEYVEYKNKLSVGNE